METKLAKQNVMKMKTFLFVVMAYGVSLPSAAQVGTTGNCPYGVPNLILSPVTAAPTQAIHITVSTSDDFYLIATASSVSAQVQGNTIVVTMVGIAFPTFPIPPPHLAACGTVIVGPLASGTYTVNYFRTLNGVPATLQASANLFVVDPIPTNTLSGLLILLSMLCIAAFFTLNRISTGLK